MVKKNKNHRPPVVVVLGHVDHGKTTLLDYIRKTNVVSKEVGQITQSIGAYEVHVPVKGYDTDRITFIDTPGHEAFSKLRLRGANVADIAVLVVDATDSVKPQTKESIAHIKQADIPVIVAINKIDLPAAKVEKVKKDLVKHKLIVEEHGGKIAVVPISAKEGTGVKDLLEAILYVASARELKFQKDADPEIYIIETVKTSAGPQVSCIIKNGTLRVADTVYAGGIPTKIRALIDDKVKRLKEVVPSTPFVILGFKEFPQVGSTLSTKPEEAVDTRQEVVQKKSLEDFLTQDKQKTLKLVLRADSQGSLEAIMAALERQKNLEIVLSAVGEIAKSDIFLAKVSQAIVVGFGLKADKKIRDLAEQEKVVIKTYNIIYRLLDELEEVSLLLQEREKKKRNIKGRAKILANFIIEGERVAGVKIEVGRISLNDTIELVRSKKLVGQAKLVSLKQKAEVVQDAKKGDEAGLILDPQLDFKVGDMIKSYSI
ncbi:MAG: translation initiation factor IF-2 [Candidatus Paceibacterota bacterium]